MPNSKRSTTKISAYIGFATKAGKTVMGVDNIIALKRPILVLYAQSLADNSKNKLSNAVKAIGHTAIEVNDLQQFGMPEACKAVGIKEKNLAEAIIKQLNN